MLVIETKMSILLDNALREISLNYSKDYMEILRFSDFKWKLTCSREFSVNGSNFTCDANVGKMKVDFYKS